LSAASPFADRPRASRLLPVLLVLISPLLGCEDERIVFRDRVLFEQPPSGAQGMLGYSDVDAGETVCGNCHVGQAAEWQLTAHAEAWDGLQSSPGAQAFCEACHTTNQLGNALTSDAGYTAAPEERYHDVQCESCHGPGLQHVQNPDATQPLASILADTAATTGCGECHSGAHHPFVDEWQQSGHGTIIAYPAGRPECQGCHTGQGALRAFGVTAEYVEKDDATQLPIVCAVCHDPHGGTNDPAEVVDGMLRFPVRNVPDPEIHLCAQCHNRRPVPDPGSSQGLSPHAPEMPLLIGDAGWFPPGVTWDQDRIRGSHGSAGNEALCATCHVTSFEAEDQLTGGTVHTTGHLFLAIPCLDASGAPTTGDCALTVQARSWQGCTGSGCHFDATAARSAFVTAAGDIRTAADSLIGLLMQVDPNLTGATGEIDAGNPTFTVAEGAYFNYRLATHGGGSGRPDTLLTVGASTVHNPFLTEALLDASIDAVLNQYNLAPPAGVQHADLPLR